MTNPEPNPYAPPTADLAPSPLPYDGEVSDYRPERRSVLLCIALTVVTGGLYPGIWLLKRQQFLNGLHASKKLGTALPVVGLAGAVVGFVLSFGGDEAKSVSSLAEFAGGIALLIATFRVLNILRSDSARTGRRLQFSGAGTFFFSVYYLQYKINKLADIQPMMDEPHRERSSARAA